MQKAVAEINQPKEKAWFQKFSASLKSFVPPLIAIIISLIVSGVVVELSGKSAMQTLQALYEGSFGTPEAFGRTLVNATPLILTGLSVALSFRAGLFNVGGEGQFFLGALTAAWLGVIIPFKGPLAILVVLVAGVLAGGLYGAIPGYLKAVSGASEVVTTIMLNYLAIYFNSFVTLKLLSAGKGFPGTAPIPLVNRISSLPGIFHNAHWGIVIALLVAVAIYILLWRTSWGYELRVTGLSQSTADYLGFASRRNIILTMAISGAMAGLAGSIEVLAVYGKMIVPFVSNVGFNGIAVALVGQVHPFGSVLAAILLGALAAGGQKIQFVSGVPLDVVNVAIGLILMTVTASRIPPVVKRYVGNLTKSFRSADQERAEKDGI